MTDGLSEILEWSSNRPAWQRDALRRLCMGAELEETDENELLSILKSAAEGLPLSSDHVRQRLAATQTVRLKAITGVENVNALAAGQRLSFGDSGLTVVYGDNGSGKSGYVRILKAACRARRERGFDIRRNIFGTSLKAPEATIVFWENATKRQVVWQKGVAPPEILAAVSVFDSSAGNIHVSGKNEIAYAPFALAILSRLARVADKLRTALTSEMGQLEAQIPPSLASHGCSPHSETGRFLRALDSETSPEAAAALATLSSEEKAELVSLRRDLADDPATIGKRSASLASRLTALSEQMDNVAAALSNDAVLHVVTTRAEIATATELAIADAKSRFADEILPVGSNEWKEMWRAAGHYAEKHVHLGVAFPQTGEGTACVLCQRPHDALSAGRFGRFDSFITDALGQQIAAGEKALATALAFGSADLLVARKIRDIREYLAGAGEPQLARAISNFLVRSAWRYRWLSRSADETSAPSGPALGAVPSAPVDTVVAALRQRAETMQGAATSPERQALKGKRGHEALGVLALTVSPYRPAPSTTASAHRSAHWAIHSPAASEHQ